MNYEWKYGPAIVAVVDKLSDVVIKINWMCVAHDEDGFSYKASGIVSTPPLNPEQFVPFEKITQEQVEKWVFDSVDQKAIEISLLEESQSRPDVLPFDF